jgi:hypothetical protein
MTLPHFGGLERLRTAHIAAMTLGVILCQSFCECISNLVFGVDGEDLDKPLSHVFSKMMISFGSFASSRAPALSSNTLQ